MRVASSSLHTETLKIITLKASVFNGFKFVDSVVLLVWTYADGRYLRLFVDVRAANLARPDDIRAYVDAAVQARTEFVAGQQNQR